MDLSQTFKFEQLKRSVQAVCAKRQIESVFLRTNIREEPIISAVSWDDAHGGVLAAIAHLLSSRFHTVVIPPSFGPSSWRSLWGSHWRIDPLWSSKAMRIVHGDAASTRAARIRLVSTEPLVLARSACAQWLSCTIADSWSVFLSSIPAFQSGNVSMLCRMLSAFGRREKYFVMLEDCSSNLRVHFQNMGKEEQLIFYTVRWAAPGVSSFLFDSQQHQALIVLRMP